MCAYQKRSPRTQKQKETPNVFIEHFYERHYGGAFINEIIWMRLSYYYLHTFLIHKLRSENMYTAGHINNVLLRRGILYIELLKYKLINSISVIIKIWS